MGEVVARGMEKWTRRCGEKGSRRDERVGEVEVGGGDKPARDETEDSEGPGR